MLVAQLLLLISLPFIEGKAPSFRLDLSTPSLSPSHDAYFTVTRGTDDTCSLPPLVRTADGTFSPTIDDSRSSIVLALVEPKRRFLFLGKEDQVVCYLTAEGVCTPSLRAARVLSLPLAPAAQVSFVWPITAGFGGVVAACEADSSLQCDGLYFQAIALQMDEDDDDDGGGADLSSKCRSHRDDAVWLAPLAAPPEDVCVSMLGALGADHAEAQADGLPDAVDEALESPSVFRQILNFFGIWTKARPNWDHNLELQVQTQMLRSVAETLGAERASCLCQIVSTLAEKVFPIFIVPLHQDSSLLDLLAKAPALMRLGLHAADWDGTVTIDGQEVLAPTDEADETDELPWIFEWIMDHVLCDEGEEGFVLTEARQILEDHLMCEAERGVPMITCTLVLQEKSVPQRLFARFIEFVAHRRDEGMCTTIGEIAAGSVDAALCVRLCAATASDLADNRLPPGQCDGGRYGELEQVIAPAELRLSGAEDGGADQGLPTAVVVGIAAGISLCCCGLIVALVVVGGLGLRRHKRAAATATPGRTGAPASARRHSRRNSTARHHSRYQSEQHMHRRD